MTDSTNIVRRAWRFDTLLSLSMIAVVSVAASDSPDLSTKLGLELHELVTHSGPLVAQQTERLV